MEVKDRFPALLPFPPPPEQLYFYLSCLLRFHFQAFFEEKLQTTISRFDLRPASTGSILAAHVGMAPAFQYKVSLCWNLTHTHTHTYIVDVFSSQPTLKLWPRFDLNRDLVLSGDGS